MLMELYLKIPEVVNEAIRLPENKKEETLLLELAILLYEKQILSYGKARELGKMTKWEFHDELGKRNIERHYNKKNLEEDLEYGKS